MALLRLTISAALTGVCLYLTACSTESLKEVIQEYGYIELRPPSTLTPPGTIVRILRTDPLESEIVCESKDSLGAHFVPIFSNTKDSRFASKANGTFKLSADYVNAISAEAKFKNVKDITITLRSARVPSLSDTIVTANVKHRNHDCQKAIDFRSEKGGNLAMISSALEADVEYGIEFKAEANLTAEAKAIIIRDISPTLQADAATATSHSIQGKSLIWGVKYDPALIEIKASTSVKTMDGIKAAKDIDEPNEILGIDNKASETRGLAGTERMSPMRIVGCSARLVKPGENPQCPAGGTVCMQPGAQCSDNPTSICRTLSNSGRCFCDCAR